MQNIDAYELDPNFATVYSFLKTFGRHAGEHFDFITIEDFKAFLEAKKVEPDNVFVLLHCKFLRGIGEKNFTNENWQKGVIKFCKDFPDGDGKLVKEKGYGNVPVEVKLRILKNLCEDQFEYNDRFNRVVNEVLEEAGDGDTIRDKPLGRDKLGRSYWFLMDQLGCLRLYRGWRNDLTGLETWNLVCRDCDELEDLIEALVSEDLVQNDPEWPPTWKTEAVTKLKDESVTKTSDEVVTKAKAEAVTKAKAEAVSDCKPEAEDEAVTKAKAEAAIVIKSGPESESDIDVETVNVETKAISVDKVDTEVESKAESDGKCTADINIKTEAEAVDVEAGSESKVKAEIGSIPDINLQAIADNVAKMLYSTKQYYRVPSPRSWGQIERDEKQHGLQHCIVDLKPLSDSDYEKDVKSKNKLTQRKKAKENNTDKSVHRSGNDHRDAIYDEVDTLVDSAGEPVDEKSSSGNNVTMTVQKRGPVETDAGLVSDCDRGDGESCASKQMVSEYQDAHSSESLPVSKVGDCLLTDKGSCDGDSFAAMEDFSEERATNSRAMEDCPRTSSEKDIPVEHFFRKTRSQFKKEMEPTATDKAQMETCVMELRKLTADSVHKEATHTGKVRDKCNYVKVKDCSVKLKKLTHTSGSKESESDTENVKQVQQKTIDQRKLKDSVVERETLAHSLVEEPAIKAESESSKLKKCVVEIEKLTHSCIQGSPAKPRRTDEVHVKDIHDTILKPCVVELEKLSTCKAKDSPAKPSSPAHKASVKKAVLKPCTVGLGKLKSDCLVGEIRSKSNLSDKVDGTDTNKVEAGIVKMKRTSSKNAQESKRDRLRTLCSDDVKSCGEDTVKTCADKPGNPKLTDGLKGTSAKLPCPNKAIGITVDKTVFKPCIVKLDKLKSTNIPGENLSQPRCGDEVICSGETQMESGSVESEINLSGNVQETHGELSESVDVDVCDIELDENQLELEKSTLSYNQETVKVADVGDTEYDENGSKTKQVESENSMSNCDYERMTKAKFSEKKSLKKTLALLKQKCLKPTVIHLKDSINSPSEQFIQKGLMHSKDVEMGKNVGLTLDKESTIDTESFPETTNVVPHKTVEQTAEISMVKKVVSVNNGDLGMSFFDAIPCGNIDGENDSVKSDRTCASSRDSGNGSADTDQQNIDNALKDLITLEEIIKHGKGVEEPGSECAITDAEKKTKAHRDEKLEMFMGFKESSGDKSVPKSGGGSDDNGETTNEATVDTCCIHDDNHDFAKCSDHAERHETDGLDKVIDEERINQQCSLSDEQESDNDKCDETAVDCANESENQSIEDSDDLREIDIGVKSCNSQEVEMRENKMIVIDDDDSLERLKRNPENVQKQTSEMDCDTKKEVKQSHEKETNSISSQGHKSIQTESKAKRKSAKKGKKKVSGKREDNDSISMMIDGQLVKIEQVSDSESDVDISASESDVDIMTVSDTSNTLSCDESKQEMDENRMEINSSEAREDRDALLKFYMSEGPLLRNNVKEPCSTAVTSGQFLGNFNNCSVSSSVPLISTAVIVCSTACVTSTPNVCVPITSSDTSHKVSKAVGPCAVKIPKSEAKLPPQVASKAAATRKELSYFQAPCVGRTSLFHPAPSSKPMVVYQVNNNLPSTKLEQVIRPGISLLSSSSLQGTSHSSQTYISPITAHVPCVRFLKKPTSDPVVVTSAGTYIQPMVFVKPVGNPTGYNQSLLGNTINYNQSLLGNSAVYSPSLFGTFTGYNQALIGNNTGYGQSLIGNSTGFNQPLIGNLTGSNQPLIGNLAGSNQTLVGSPNSCNQSERLPYKQLTIIRGEDGHFYDKQSRKPFIFPGKSRVVTLWSDGKYHEIKSGKVVEVDLNVSAFEQKPHVLCLQKKNSNPVLKQKNTDPKVRRKNAGIGVKQKHIDPAVRNKLREAAKSKSVATVAREKERILQEIRKRRQMERIERYKKRLKGKQVDIINPKDKQKSRKHDKLNRVKQHKQGKNLKPVDQRKKPKKGRPKKSDSEAGNESSGEEPAADEEDVSADSEYDYEKISRRVRMAQSGLLPTVQTRDWSNALRDSDMEMDYHTEQRKPLIFGRNAKLVTQTRRVFSLIQDSVDEELKSPCKICEERNYSESLLLCDECDESYHMTCLSPPLVVFPLEEWFCPECEHYELIEVLKKKRMQARRFRNKQHKRDLMKVPGVLTDDMFKVSEANILQRKSGRSQKEVNYSDEKFDKLVIQAVKDANTSSSDSESEVPSKDNKTSHESAAKPKKRKKDIRLKQRKRPSRKCKQKGQIEKKRQKLTTLETEGLSSNSESDYSCTGSESSEDYTEPKEDRLEVMKEIAEDAQSVEDVYFTSSGRKTNSVSRVSKFL